MYLLRPLQLTATRGILLGVRSRGKDSLFVICSMLIITEIHGEIQYFYGTFQYIMHVSTFSIIYDQNPNFNEKIESYNTKKWGRHLIFRHSRPPATPVLLRSTDADLYNPK